MPSRRAGETNRGWQWWTCPLVSAKAADNAIAGHASLGTQLQLDFHSLGNRLTRHFAARRADSFPAEFHLPVQVIVATVRVVMEQTQAAYPRLHGQVCGIGKRGMAPAAGPLILLFGILGVVKQHVRPSAKVYVLFSPQPSWMPEAKLIVRKVYESLSPLNELVAVSTIRVIQCYRADLQSVQAAVAGLPMRALATELEMGLQELEVNRKEGGLHLFGKAAS